MKAVFFDLDGTLCNTLPDLCASTNYALRTFDFPTLSEAQVCARVGNGITKLIERAVPADRQDAVPMVTSLFLAHYGRHCTDRTVPYDGMVETLHALKARGLLLGVISNKVHESTAKICNTLLGTDVFSLIRGQTADFPLKPDPAVLLAVMEEFGLAKADVVYVGDSDVDLEFAKNAGVRAIGCAWGFRGRKFLAEHGADTILDAPNELIQTMQDGGI